MIIMYLFLVEKKEVKKEPIDYLGSLTLMIALLSLMFGFQKLGESIALTPVLVGSFMVAIISFSLFVKIERKAVDPIIPLNLFHNQEFVKFNIVASLVSGFLISVMTYIPMWLQGVHGFDALKSGFAMTPMSITWVLGSFISSQLIMKYSAKKILTLSVFIVGIGSMCLALSPISTPFFIFLLIAALLGIGFGITITTTTVTVQNIVPQEQLGVATSFNTLARTLGQTIMVSVYGIVLNVTIANSLVTDKNKGVNSDMMDKLLNPLTAKELSPEKIPILKNILYSGIHGIFLVAGGVVIFALTIIFIKTKNKQNNYSEN